MESAFSNPEIIALFLGPTIGFLVFFTGVSTMEGIFFRPDNENNKIFTMEGFIDFLKAPFQKDSTKFKILWANMPDVDLKGKLKMLQLNWVAMTGLGLATSATGIAIIRTIQNLF